MFSEAYDAGLHPQEFVNNTRKKGKLIMGIGHRVKSINNPDMRVKLIKEFVVENFPAKPLVEYALEVEKITTSKKPNLILNVDGIIACAFVDMLRNSGSFTREEAQEYIEIGAINSLFVLGRSIGFIGTFTLSTFLHSRALLLVYIRVTLTSVIARWNSHRIIPLIFFSSRTLHGPEKTKARPLPSSVGRHFLHTTGAI